MKALTERILHYLLLVVVTLFAVGVMWRLSAKDRLATRNSQPAVRPLPEVAVPKAPVAVESLGVEVCEITSTYAGKIQSWETYQIGFAVGGRVIALGKNAGGQPLDEGDRVAAGQALATLDDRVFRARRSEAAARIEQATSDLQRAQRVRQANPTALSESELQRLVTDLALAKAGHEVAVKNLDDATLKSPVDATISKRWIKSGESVNSNQFVFELVENDDVLLVVDVPETHIRELEQRMRAVEKNLASNNGDVQPEDKHFYAHVHLEGRNRFGDPWPALEGEVHRIPEVADQRTGLFPVEIRLGNAERLLRPGMVATADVVTGRIPGYQVPESAIIFRQRRAHLFTISKETTEMEMLYWNVGPADVYRARRVPLTRWVDQGPHVVIPADQAELSSVVVRGHFRLADSQLVRIVNLDALSPGITAASAAPTKRVSIAAER